MQEAVESQDCSIKRRRETDTQTKGEMPREREKVRDRHREKTVVLLNVLIQLPTK